MHGAARGGISWRAAAESAVAAGLISFIYLLLCCVVPNRFLCLPRFNEPRLNDLLTPTGEVLMWVTLAELQLIIDIIVQTDRHHFIYCLETT